MQRWARRTLSGGAVVGLAAGLLAVGTAAGSPPDVAPPPGSAPAVRSAQGSTVEELQLDLERVPGSYPAWSALGLASVGQARVTADPTLCAKAEGAFATSLELRPQDNDAALAGRATLAAARHDVADALALTDSALAVDSCSPTTWAVRSDALTELGRYDEARAAVQRLLDLSPDGIDAIEAAAGAAGAVRQALRRALDLNPTFSLLHAPRASARLERLGG